MEILGLIDLPLWLILIVAVVVLYIVYMSWDFDTFKKMGIDGPKPFVCIGNKELFTEGFAECDINWYKKYGTMYGTFEFNSPVLNIADPALIKEVMVKDFNSFVNRRTFGVFDEQLADMLTDLKDEHWRFVRQTITPTFSGSKLRKMIPHINQAADSLMENLEQKTSNNEDANVCPLMGAFTMDVIARTAFGLQIDSQKNPNDPFIKHVKAFNSSTSILFVLTCLTFFPFLRGLPNILQNMGLKFTRDATNFFVKVTEEALKERKENPGKYADFLQLMVNAQPDDGDEDSTSSQNGKGAEITRKKLNNKEIRSQAVLFFIAGYETTSHTLSFTLYHLAIYPEICDKVLQEVDEKVGENEPTYDSVLELQYLEKVICETLRLFPIAPRVDRTANREVTIGNVKIPKGMVVNIPIGAIQKDPQYWPDPETFDPERFTPEAKAERDPFTYLPFGGGPRSCIGMRLANLELKMCLARILQRYKPIRTSKTEVPVKIAKLKGNVPKDECIWMKFEKRN